MHGRWETDEGFLLFLLADFWKAESARDYILVCLWAGGCDLVSSFMSVSCFHCLLFFFMFLSLFALFRFALFLYVLLVGYPVSCHAFCAALLACLHTLDHARRTHPVVFNVLRWRRPALYDWMMTMMMIIDSYTYAPASRDLVSPCLYFCVPQDIFACWVLIEIFLS